MTHRIMQEMQKLKKCDLLQIKTLNEYTPPPIPTEKKSYASDKIN